jgi:hypothetical protein
MKHTIEEWCLMAHNLACVKGFHTGPDGNPVDHRDPIRIGARLALIHSELSEALECITLGKEEFYLGENGKPEGLGVELADATIRTFDFAEALRYRLREPEILPVKDPPRNDPETKASAINELHYIVGAMGEQVCAETVQFFVDCTFSIAKYWGIDLWEMIACKHEYNSTRPRRHGGKLL